MPDEAAIELSVVIPLYDEEGALPALFARLRPALEATGVRYEIVCVNDGSQDGTLRALLALIPTTPGLVVVDLSRNFGKEAALSAGLDLARGAAVVPMDGDLQDPPELIAPMLARWREGYEVVYAVRGARAGESWAKRLSSWLFYRVFNSISRTRIPADAGDFRLMDRRVVEALRRLPERTRLMKGLFAWVGFRHVAIEFPREARSSGRSRWSAFGLLRLAVNGMISFSSLPLRVWTVFGFFVACFAFSYGVFLIARVLIYGRDVPGYASLMVVCLFAFGTQLITLGTIGEYISRIFDEVKQRPLYLVREVHRKPSDSPSAG
jgi:glycosyltransferase involved in cell wall biosynthesis